MTKNEICKDHVVLSQYKKVYESGDHKEIKTYEDWYIKIKYKNPHASKGKKL
jgi:hypothetical protein